MRKFLAICLCLLALPALADFPNGNNFNLGSFTNVPATIVGGTTSNINAIVFTSGRPVAVFPRYSSTNTASAGNMILSFASASDRTLTNWNTANLLLCTNTLTGMTAIEGKFLLPASEADPVGAFKLVSIQCTDGATNNISIPEILFSMRY